jgi:hypothetical protein
MCIDFIYLINTDKLTIIIKIRFKLHIKNPQD